MNIGLLWAALRPGRIRAWALLGRSWGRLGTSSAAPGPSWAALGSNFGLLGVTFSSFLGSFFGGLARGLQKSSFLTFCCYFDVFGVF